MSSLGFSGSFVALITPMKSDGSVDIESLKRLTKWHIEQGTKGLVVLGTTAETATLTEQEQLLVLETVISENDGVLPIIVGNGSNCTRTTVEKTMQLDELEIDGYLTVTPYYNKPTQKGMIAHFKAVAGATEKPVILYNVPGRTAVDLSNEAVFELMSVDNIVGIKDATGDISRVAQMKQQNAEFLLFSGDDISAKDYLLAGGDGVITVTGNVEPQKMSEMVEAAVNKDESRASEIDKCLVGLHKDLFIEPNPVPSKWALREKGLISSDMVRLPLLPLEPNSENAIKEALKSAEK